MSGEPRRAQGFARRRAACWPAVVALGLLGGFGTPSSHAQATVAAATFGNPTSIAFPNTLTAMVTADVNGDGKTDIVTAYNVNGSAGGICVMLGQNNGSFKSPTFWGLGPNGVPASGPALGLAVADLNGDKKPDIVTANLFTGDGSFGGVPAIINMWFQSGNGNFANQQGYTASAGLFGYDYYGPTSVTVSDVDGSGKPEIIVGSGGVVDVWAYWSSGQYSGWGVVGHYNPPTSGGWVWMPAAVGDVNGDGKPDVVASGGSQVDVLLNAGNGTFAAAQTYGVASGSIAVAVGDVNGDGKLDIVTAGYYSSNVNVLLNNGDGTFGAAQVYATAATPNSIALGDFNADGKLDIATTGTEIDVLLNNGDGTLAAAYAVGPAGSSVNVADFNGDGLPDLAQIDGSGTSVDVLLNTSTPPSSGGGGKGHK
jgi:hypothetical protein